MINYLVYISDGLIIVGIISYLLLVFVNNNKKITNSDGFNITKDILNEYDSINIIENKSYFTIYNIKRRVIKVASKYYYGNSISSIAIPLMEAGIYVVDNNKNKFISFFSKIISNLKYLYIFPIIAIILNHISTGSSDAKIGIILVAIFSLIMYIFINIKSEGNLFIINKLKKNKDIENKDMVINFLNKIILFDKFIFIGELVMIIRFVAIVLKYN